MPEPAASSPQPDAVTFWVISYFEDTDAHIIVHEKLLGGITDPGSPLEKVVVVEKVDVKAGVKATILVNAPVKHIFDTAEPVRWVDGQDPPGPGKEPPGLRITHLSPTQIRIVESNQEPTRNGESFHFLPNFQLLREDGSTSSCEGGDPTIFNEGFGKPPDGRPKPGGY